MAAELAHLEFGDLIENMAAEGSSPAPSPIAWPAWDSPITFAAATILPYRQFHDVAENFRYDVERLSAFYQTSYETICHRLSTLQRPSMRGVPSRSFESTGPGTCRNVSPPRIFTSSSGGTCPLWNVYETFASPGKILVQMAQMPDGRNYLWVARTVERRAARYGQPGKTFAIGLGCEIRHASRLIYSTGLDLSGGQRHPDRGGLPCLRARQLPTTRLPRPGAGARPRRASEHRVALPGEAVMTCVPLPGGRSWVSLNWVISKVAARAIRAPEMHLFTTLGRHRLLFLSFLPYPACFSTKVLPKADKELVILRVGHLRGSEYELQQHRRLARSRGVDTTLQDKIFTGPPPRGSPRANASCWSPSTNSSPTATPSDDTFAALADHLTKEQIIEFCALTGHYDAIAAIAATLRVPMDFPE